MKVKMDRRSEGLMKERVEEHLQTRWLGKNIIYKDEIDSTNLCAKKLGEENVMNGTVVIAEKQTAGRGRRGRKWVSPEGNCYFSILLRPRIRVEHASRLTLVAALALAEAIMEVSGLQVQIKWPNDVVINGKKLCGILTESSFCDNGLKYVVIGIGINVNQEVFAEEIQEMATSIIREKGELTDCACLIGAFLNYFEHLEEQFVCTEDLSGMQERYNELLVNRNREVRILDEEEWVGVALGINEKGELLVHNSQGDTKAVFAGEISVRGIYGYV